MHRYIGTRPPLRFLIAAGGSEIFAGVQPPNPPSSTALGPICGSIWPPGALRGTPARREFTDPQPPSSPSTVAGADGGTASSCGKDSNSSAAVTGNLTGPEMAVSGAASSGSGSTSLGVSDVWLGLQALDLVKYEESILTDKRLLYYTEQSGNILLNCQTKQWLLANFLQEKYRFYSTFKDEKCIQTSALHFKLYEFDS